ncbi:pyruvate formate-lyase-activating protein [Streptomyces mirabilis]|uniref:hypothetical protein n=1 Tax=Streptomyces mirabilis TaxID=68239 RepID=UPI003697285B
MTATVTAGTRAPEAWRGYAGTRWRECVDVRDFIQANYTPYEGDGAFLTGPTDRTRTVWDKVSALIGARATDELLADTNLVLLDIKSFDVSAYRQLTGGELAPTLNFATRLDRLGIPTWIRYVLVPGWTDAPEAVAGLARFVAGLGNVDRVDVLPFHKLGASKYEALGIPFPLRDTPVPEPELTERVREQFRECGLAAY